jgi:hypothetical protein
MTPSWILSLGAVAPLSPSADAGTIVGIAKARDTFDDCARKSRLTTFDGWNMMVLLKDVET